MFRENAKTSISKALIVYLIANKPCSYINVNRYDTSNAEAILFDVADATLMSNRGLVADCGQLFNWKHTVELTTAAHLEVHRPR
jgi:hypothetical protein